MVEEYLGLAQEKCGVTIPDRSRRLDRALKIERPKLIHLDQILDDYTRAPITSELGIKPSSVLTSVTAVLISVAQSPRLSPQWHLNQMKRHIPGVRRGASLSIGSPEAPTNQVEMIDPHRVVSAPTGASVALTNQDDMTTRWRVPSLANGTSETPTHRDEMKTTLCKELEEPPSRTRADCLKGALAKVFGLLSSAAARRSLRRSGLTSEIRWSEPLSEVGDESRGSKPRRQYNPKRLLIRVFNDIDGATFTGSGDLEDIGWLLTNLCTMVALERCSHCALCTA